MIYKPLGEVCDFLSGFAWRSSQFRKDPVGLPVIRIQNIGNSTNGSTVYWNGDYDEKYVINKNDLLLGLSGSIKIGRWEGEKALLNQRIVKITPKEKLVTEKWLEYVIDKKINEISYMGNEALVNNVSINDLRNLNIPLPTFDEQTRIAEILDKADGLRQKRKESIKLLDDYLRFTFLDMFGDPVVNPKGWDFIKFGDSNICEEMRYGTSVKCSDYQFSNSLPVLRIPNIIGNKIDYSDLKYCNLSKKEIEKLQLKIGDLLFVRTNGNPNYIARCAVFNDNEKYLYASYLIRIRLKTNSKFHPKFLQTCFSTKTYRSKIIKETRTTAGNYNINTQGLKNFDLIKPPYDDQLKYVEIVDQVEKLKIKYQESEKELDNLFGSLMQRAFRGEL